MRLPNFLLFLVICTALSYVKCDMFTSVYRMEGALRDSFSDIINDLDTYVEEEVQKLNELSGWVDSSYYKFNLWYDKLFKDMKFQAEWSRK